MKTQMKKRVYSTIHIGLRSFPRNRVPMEFYDEWRTMNRGVKVWFRGPRHPGLLGQLVSKKTQHIFTQVN